MGLTWIECAVYASPCGQALPRFDAVMKSLPLPGKPILFKYEDAYPDHVPEPSYDPWEAIEEYTPMDDWDLFDDIPRHEAHIERMEKKRGKPSRQARSWTVR